MRLDLSRDQLPEPGLQPVCGFTQDDYAQLLADLLPRGWAWTRDPASVLMRTFAGLAAEFARVHERDCDLLREAYPGTAFETLTDWERICGLPNPCIEPPLSTLEQRRAAVLARLAARGGQSRAYYIAVAAALGFEITITEFRPFRVGRNAAGDAIFGQGWIFTWEINSAGVPIFPFEVGRNTAGDPLRIWQANLLECVIEPLKPAHTILHFTYGGGPNDAGQ